MRKLLLILGVAILIALGILLANHTALSFSNIKSYLASVFFTDSITANDLRTHYNNSKVKILIVPGHDNEYSGTSFAGLREADVTVAIGADLAALFEKDPHFQVTVSRDSSGYSPVLLDYLASHKADILAFEKNQQTLMSQYMKEGKIVENVAVEHHTAPSTVAFRLWGINKWANNNNIDLVIHLHINDYAGRRAGKSGPYKGFVIYTPEFQFSNAKASNDIADYVKSMLAAHYPISNLPAESAGIVPDQELIAIGSNNSLNPASMLIEYGYIYEPGIQNPQTRQATISTFAQDTYQGVKNFFEAK